MKYLFCLVITISIFPQERGWNYSEIFMITRGLDANQSIRYKMEAVSIVWFNNNPGYPYFITSAFNEAYYPPLKSEWNW